MKESINLYAFKMHNGDTKDIVALNVLDAMRYVDEENYNFIENLEVKNLVFSLESVKKILPKEETN